MSDEWASLSAQAVRDLVGKRVRILVVGGLGPRTVSDDTFAFRVRDCCERVDVRIVVRDGHMQYQERRTPNNEDPEV
jgi:hypothetical protein